MPQVGIQDGWPSDHRISPPPPVPPGLGSGGYGSGLSSGFGVSSMTPLGLNHGLGVPPPPPPLPVPEVLGRIEEPSRYVQALPKLEDYTPEQGAVILGDWIVTITPVIGSLTASASSWLEEILRQVHSHYSLWLCSDPVPG